MEDIGFVYVWIHRDSGKYYIGSHSGHPDDGYVTSGKLIRRAIGKHGIEAFDRVIDYVGPNFREEETDLIRFFDACNCPLGYNIMHMTRGFAQHGPEARKNMSLAAKSRVRKPFTEAHKNNLSAALNGHEVSDETRAKMSTAMKGRKLTEEHKRKIGDGVRGESNAMADPVNRAKVSSALKGKVRSPEARENIRAAALKRGPMSEEHKALRRGKKASEETRAKMRASHAARHQQSKA